MIIIIICVEVIDRHRYCQGGFHKKGRGSSHMDIRLVLWLRVFLDKVMTLAMVTANRFRAGKACWIKWEHGRDDPNRGSIRGCPATVSGESASEFSPMGNRESGMRKTMTDLVDAVREDWPCHLRDMGRARYRRVGASHAEIFRCCEGRAVDGDLGLIRPFRLNRHGEHGSDQSCCLGVRRAPFDSASGCRRRSAGQLDR